jgi:hypothetical protein
MNALALEPARCQRTPMRDNGALASATLALASHTQPKAPLRISRTRAIAVRASRLPATGGFSFLHHPKAKDWERSTGSSNL